jgi:hypothetical protein
MNPELHFTIFRCFRNWVTLPRYLGFCLVVSFICFILRRIFKIILYILEMVVIQYELRIFIFRSVILIYNHSSKSI